jgi:PAS domain S-box-containing protein
VRIEIENRGTVPDDLLPILFAPFRGSQQSSKRQGLGLGLFITDQIVRAHAGTIEVSSRDDVTTFTIHLPRHHGEPSLTTFDVPETAGAPEPRQIPSVREDILRDVIESIREYAIFLLDARGNILTWNRGAQRIKGYTAEEAIGRHFSMFYPREDIKAGKTERELAIALRDGQYEEQGWRLRKDGTPFWANVLITAIHDRSGNHIGFAKVTRDMTDERMAREAAHRSDERFRLLVEGVRDYAIFMLDADSASRAIAPTRSSGATSRRSIRRRKCVPASASASSRSRRATAGSRKRAGAFARTAASSGRVS